MYTPLESPDSRRESRRTRWASPAADRPSQSVRTCRPSTEGNGGFGPLRHGEGEGRLHGLWSKQSCLTEKERRDRSALHLFDCSGSGRRAERARSDRGVRPSVKLRKYGRSSQSRAGLPQRRFPMPPGVVLYEIGVKPKWIGRFAWIEWPLVMKIIRPPVHNFFLGPASNARSGASLGRRESSRKEMASQPWDGFEIFL